MGFNGFFTPLPHISHCLRLVWGLCRIRGLDVPTTEVELGHCDEALHGVFNLGQRKERLGVGHEAGTVSNIITPARLEASHLVMRSNMDRGSRMKVGRVTRLRSAPGRSCDMMCESTATLCQPLAVHSQLLPGAA